MAIYKVENGYVISSKQVWLPGAYADERAAKYAFQFPDEVLSKLQKIVGHGLITFEMLQAEAKKRKAKSK